MNKKEFLPSTVDQNPAVKPLLTVLTFPFVLGVLGGVCTFLFCAGVMFFSAPHTPQIGVLDREKLIQEMANEVAASDSLSEAALLQKLQSYKQFFDQAIKTLTVTKKIILLNRSAVISANVADYTQEIRTLINSLAPEKTSQRQTPGETQ